MCLPILSAHAQTTWLYPSGGDWFDTNNWSSGLPSSLKDADIDNGGAPVLNSMGAVRKLRIGVADYGSLSITGALASLSSLETTLGVTADSTATVSLAGPHATWGNSSDRFIVGQSGEAHLLVGHGAVLSTGSISDTTSAVLGAEVGSVGTVSVSGVNSNWTVASGLTIGGKGTGHLVISNEATVSSAGHPSYVAESENSTGTVRITGQASTFSVEVLEVGYGGAGSLTIENGGHLQGNVVAGYGIGSLAAITVDGQGSTMTNIAGLSLGVSGEGQLSVTHGATVSSGPSGSLLGNLPGSTGSATVDGTGSSWALKGNISVGGSGTGTLTISDGGHVAVTSIGGSGSASGKLGVSSGGTGLITVTGAGSSFSVGSQLLIGAEGSGELQIKQGGVVANQEAIAALAPNATAKIEVQSATWKNTADVHIAEYGKATLSITDGSQVTSNSGVIALRAGSIGTATISASTWNIQGGLIVGPSGTGNLAILDGAVVSSKNGSLGQDSSSGDGTVSVVGPGSAWLNSGLLLMGVHGAAILDASNGATVTSAGASIGTQSTTGARFSLTGTGTTYVNSGTTDVGRSGTGRFEVLDGATAKSALARMAIDTDDVGTVVVSGAGSDWSSSKSLTVADKGSAQLTISSGASVSSDGSVIGSQTTAVGQVDVTGLGSKWTNSKTMTIGDFGSGQLKIASGGKVTTPDVFMGVHAGASGQAAITGPGSEWTIEGSLTMGYFGASNLTVADGGRVSAASGLGFEQSQLQIEIGGTLEVADLTIAGSAVNQGHFVGDVLVTQGGQLSGSGQFDGVVTVAEGGSFSPGSSPGTASTATTVWSTEGSYRWEINASDDTGGVEGQAVGWDLWHTGALTVNDSFRISMLSLGLANSSGPLGNWNPFAAHQWRIATADGPAFSELDKLILDDSGFINPLEGGAFSLSASADGQSLFVNFSPVPEPSTLALTAVCAATLLTGAARRRLS